MCGRYTLRTSPAELAKIFELLRTPDLVPRYNIAPTQTVAAIREMDGQRELSLLHWGLIPSWAKDPSIGSRMINARSETVAEKPSFRSAFKSRRCLIPADGFYEWRKQGRGKQPYYIHRRDGQPFAFAGLWEKWSGAGQIVESCTIITGAPNALMAEIHDRMPVILSPDDYATWLNPKASPADDLTPLLVPYPANELTAGPVNPIVNNARNETPACIEPLDTADGWLGA